MKKPKGKKGITTIINVRSVGDDMVRIVVPPTDVSVEITIPQSCVGKMTMRRLDK